MQVYHLAINGIKKDNLTFYRVREMIHSGEVDAKTLAWAQGMDTWRPLGEISEFQKVFNEETGEKATTAPAKIEVAAKGQPIDREKRREPWRRLGARTLDSFVFSLPLLPVYLFLVPQSHLQPPSIWVQIISLPVTALFCSLCEAFSFSKFGKTLGKWAFGISVTDQHGHLLSFKRAFQRSLLAWVRGMALLIPFVAPVAMLLAHARLLTFGTTSWDRDLRTKVEFRKPTGLGKGVAALFFIALGIMAYFQIQREMEKEKKEQPKESKEEGGSEDDSKTDQSPSEKPDDSSENPKNIPPLTV